MNSCASATRRPSARARGRAPPRRRRCSPRSCRRRGTECCSTKPICRRRSAIVAARAGRCRRSRSIPRSGSSRPGEALDQRRFAGARAADERDRRPRRRRRARSSTGSARSGARVGEPDAAQLDAALQPLDRPQVRLVVALLGLVVEDVLQPAEQDGRELHLVPRARAAADQRRAGQQHQRVERAPARRASGCRARTCSAPNHRNRAKIANVAVWTIAA